MVSEGLFQYDLSSSCLSSWLSSPPSGSSTASAMAFPASFAAFFAASARAFSRAASSPAVLRMSLRMALRNSRSISSNSLPSSLCSGSRTYCSASDLTLVRQLLLSRNSAWSSGIRSNTLFSQAFARHSVLLLTMRTVES